ncbi:thiosulfate sulfurtransferase GlpE [Flocculibacter collagenilyticus]|uniref:thiosulfate sulfurtransferase GlpE n=1 Tax=Flocculibacter collagenilyticus TaxID=2744479 RepID=UPI0018F329BA|nr:thiosulfate sulfurtransferase GlpE [Flocculibacter collagenilyticus]
MDQFKHISITETKQKLDNGDVVIADIRDDATFANGHIDGAFHLNNGTIVEFMNQHDFDQPVVVACYHGHSSQGAAQYLLHQGFEEVYSMDGGMTAWAMQFPVVRSGD